jgi:hypothetical protein
MSTGQLNEIKHTLLRFLQDKRVKVSLFLQDGLQLQNGTIVLRPTLTPPEVEMPGVV